MIRAFKVPLPVADALPFREGVRISLVRQYRNPWTLGEGYVFYEDEMTDEEAVEFMLRFDGAEPTETTEQMWEIENSARVKLP